MSTRFTHTSVAGASGSSARRSDHRPAAGSITVLPEGRASVFTEAVGEAGGDVVPLGPDTKAIVWLANDDPSSLLTALDENPQVQWVQLPWAGVDAFADVLRDRSRDDLLWTSAKGAYAQPVAEHALTLLLASLRSLGARARATSWGEKSGESLYGRNVVIVGAGGIAVELIRLLEPFGVNVTIVRRSDAPVEGADRTVPAGELDSVLPEADAIVIAAAATSETRSMFGAGQFALLKPTAVLVNIARGPLVDTDALTVALREGRLYAAGLDVTDPEPLPDGHPLWSEERVIITPHSADTPDMIAPLLAERIRHNVAAYLGGGEFDGVVDPTRGY
ncbi:D-isomer specific 2-hydroxyacid dehydrogenase family protein [Amnibacterium flavum]|uniref:Hydroxyacid dehydrogenase n=1 Tax=Amnibacterium flavum TaxID=2173173 RepID=A0A2V1HVI1_9MICO|nr:D-isomer specific 2-hydroxyacid dehydrogenase family protein [Amnibacterium flavum]PVZ94154.1 hydroxyacid dehydrogenase [Amnibacterium flavum]